MDEIVDKIVLYDDDGGSLEGNFSTEEIAGSLPTLSLSSRFLLLAQLYYTPLLCLFGVIGNGLSVTVFRRSNSHRNLSSSFYLSALAISDTGFLFTLIAVWIDDLQLGFRIVSFGLLCPIIMFIGQVTCFLSVWLTVAFTVERFFAVCYPLTRPTVCTVSRAKKVISALSLIAVLAFSYVFVIAQVIDMVLPTHGDEDILFNNTTDTSYTTSSSSSSSNSQDQNNLYVLTSSANGLFEDGDVDGIFLNNKNDSISEEFPTSIRICTVRDEHLYFSSIASYIDSFVTLILPFIIITYLNIRISVCVWRLKDQRQNIMAIGNIGGSRSPQPSCKNPQNDRDRVTSVKFHNQTIIINENDDNGKKCTKNGAPSLSPILKKDQPNPSQNHGNCSNNKSGYFNRMMKNRLTMTNNPNSSNSNGGSQIPQPSSNAAEVRVTKTLLLVSTVFLVLNLPAHLLRAIIFIKSLWYSSEEQPSEELQAAMQWSNILFNTNFSVNFLLYCVSGRNFRKSLRSLLIPSSSSRRGPKKKKAGKRLTKPIIQNNQRRLSPDDVTNNATGNTNQERGSIPSMSEVETTCA